MAAGISGERRWVWFFGFLVTGLAAIPYLVGFLNQGDAYRFTGFVFGVYDGNSYIAKMLSGHSGAWLFSTPFTTFPQSGVLVFLPYLLAGKLAGSQAVHSQLVFLFHLFRILAGFLVIHATYSFVSLFLETVFLRRVSLILITIGGGLGWLLLAAGRDEWFGSLPLEYYSPESFGFLAIFGLPHLALARGLLLYGFVVLVKAMTPPGRVSTSTSASPDQVGASGTPGFELRRALKPGITLGALWLGVGLSQPVSLALAWGLTGLYLAAGLVMTLAAASFRTIWGFGWLKRGAGIAAIACLVSSPFLIYTAERYLHDPFLLLWGERNILSSPHPFHYLVAYGLLLPFALIGLTAGFKRIPTRILLPAVWTFAFPVLVYAPVTIQRRLPEGVWVALVVLAVLGIQSISQRSGVEKKVAYILTLLALPASFLLVLGGIVATARPSLPVYRPAGEVAAFLDLADRAEPGEVVLTAFETGNALPAWAPLRVVMGHGPESIQLEARQIDVQEFFSQATSALARIEILQRLGVSYVFWGPEERRIGTWDPGSASFLTPVFEESGYSVFKVVSP